ncbi:AAA family ATPase [Lacrimispora sp. 38-1]|uniref:AAA family ATPase n=1 Tax=Lacrimispora sp. 38-1 TaxID=3125778 RepID=UPI003CE8EFDF
MKPLKLTMSAFGSYKDVETVDFEIAGHGIFLITGDTGSGKTTIFDAVSFALFGETSGQRREPSMMRSQYADGDRETFVALRFLEQGEIYEITRSPSYLRISKRKNKDGEYAKISVPAKASLILPTGLEFAGNLRDINQKIEEIIGVDLSQFSQIAMIAQGDYLKLLLAASRERKEIFSRIFNTGIYSRIQYKLKEKNNFYAGKLEDNRKLTIHETGNVELLQDSIHEDEWLKLLEYPETKTEEIINRLSAILNEIRDKEKLLSDEREKNSELLSSVQSKRNLALEQNRLFDRLQEASDRVKALKLQSDDWNRKKEQLARGELAEKAYTAEIQYKDKKSDCEAALKREKWLEEELKKTEEILAVAKKAAMESREVSQNEVPKLSILLDRLNSSMPLYEDWRKTEELCRIRKKEEEESQKRFEEAENEYGRISLRLKEYEKQQELLTAAAAKLPELRLLKAEYTGKEEALKNLFPALKQIRSDQLLLARLRLSEEAAQTAYEEAQFQYSIRYQSFFNQQAGLLARDLIEGNPCPVCGSVHHPQKAKLSGERITAEMVDEARMKRDQANESRSEAELLAVKKQESCRHQEELIKKEAGLLLDPSSDWDSLEEQLIVKEKETKLLLIKAEDEEKQARKAEEKLKSLIENKQKDRNRITILEREREELRSVWQDKKVKNSALSAQREQLEKRLPYPDLRQAKIQQEKLKNRIDLLLSAEKEANEKFLLLSEEEREKRGRLASLKENREVLLTAQESTKEAYFSQLCRLGFSDEEEYLKAKMSSEQIKTWQQEVRGYEEACLTAETIFNQYKDETKGRERIDTSLWEEEADALQKEQKILQLKSAEIAGIKSRAERAESNLKKLWKERKELEKQYQLYHSLNQTANGKLSVSLDFQTYVQRQYFNQMVHAANKRLKVMSDGQFLLQCRDLNSLGKQGEVGLDLDVYSLATGQVRDVKTLSGGESFMAALAMALGMADIIQRTAGNVRMDAMFIDEGFGSLDEESRLRAVRILLELAGEHRLIGIISHVSELKEQIDKKLTVIKSESGSKIRWDLDHITAI